MRWVAVLGSIDAGRGPATHRTGEAFLRARALLDQARADRDGLLCQTGDPDADAYLAGTAPVLAAIIDRMTDRQRQVAALALVDGLRQSEIADRLDVARPTVSVITARGDVRNLARLADAVRAIWADGVERVTAPTRAPDALPVPHERRDAGPVVAGAVPPAGRLRAPARVGRDRASSDADRALGGRCSSTPRSWPRSPRP